MLAGQLYWLFFALAAVFGGMSLLDYLKSDRLTPAAKVRLRMSIIFFAVGVFLVLSRSGSS